MKIKIIILFISTLLGYSGHSGIYFENGLILDGSYIMMDSDGDAVSQLYFSFIYKL